MLTKKKLEDNSRDEGEGLRVLLAEDEALVAAELQGQLEEMGHKVVAWASDGQAAVDAARLHKPDIVLMDIRMPGRHGLSAAREITEEIRVPCVVISAYSDQQQVSEAQDAGAFGYVVKPVMPEQLRVSIEMAIDRACRSSADQALVADLRRRLDERRVIEQAKWIIVESERCTERHAHERLQSTSRAQRASVIDIAKMVVHVGRLAGPAEPNQG